MLYIVSALYGHKLLLYFCFYLVGLIPTESSDLSFSAYLTFRLFLYIWWIVIFVLIWILISLFGFWAKICWKTFTHLDRFIALHSSSRQPWQLKQVQNTALNQQFKTKCITVKFTVNKDSHLIHWIFWFGSKSVRFINFSFCPCL